MQLLGQQNSGPEGCISVMPSMLKVGFIGFTGIDSVVSEGGCRTPPAPALLLLSKSSSPCLGGDPRNYAHTDHPEAACRVTTSQAVGQKVIRLWGNHC